MPHSLVAKRRSNGTYASGSSGNPEGRRAEKTDAPSAAKSNVLHMDAGWMNWVTGHGIAGRDKREGTFFEGENFSFDVLAELVEKDDISAKAVENPVKEALRPGWDITTPEAEDDGGQDDSGAESERVREVNDKIKKLGGVQALKDCLCWERGLGGAAALLGANDGSTDMTKPLDLDEVTARSKFLRGKKGSTETGFDWITPLDPREIYPKYGYTDPRQPKYGQPEIYQTVSRAVWPSQGGQYAQTVFDVHESRLLVFPGIRATRFQPHASQGGWGVSVIARMWRVLRDYNLAWGSTGALISEFARGTYKWKDLIETLSTESGRQGAVARLQFMEWAASTINATVIDADDDYKREAIPLSGLADLLNQFATRLAAAADQPLTVLFGTSPAGLNATGDSDIRLWYDRLDQFREDKIKPPAERIVDLAFRTTGDGQVPDRWNIRFRPLWQQTAEERSKAMLTQSQADHTWFQDGVLSAEEIAESHWGSGEWNPEIKVNFKARKQQQLATHAAVTPEDLHALGKGNGPGPGGEPGGGALPPGHPATPVDPTAPPSAPEDEESAKPGAGSEEGAKPEAQQQQADRLDDDGDDDLARLVAALHQHFQEKAAKRGPQLTAKQAGILKKNKSAAYQPPPPQGSARASRPTSAPGPAAAPDPNTPPQSPVLADDSADEDPVWSRGSSGEKASARSGKWSNGGESGASGPPPPGQKRLYRAADGAPVAWAGAHFSPNFEVARAYTDNPGFGGPKIHQFDVDPAYHLDLYKEEQRHGARAALEKLAGELEYKDPEDHAQDWSDAGYKRVYQVLENDADALKRTRDNYDWISFQDDYPPDAETWRYLGSDKLSGTELHADAFSPEQPRDQTGKWAVSGSGSGGTGYAADPERGRSTPEEWLKKNPTGNGHVFGVAQDYLRSTGHQAIGVVSHQALTPEEGREIADTYDRAKDDPKDPETRAAYGAFNAELAQQRAAAEGAGYKFEPWAAAGQPYATSKEMMADVRDHKHLYYFKTSEGTTPNELMSPAQNDTFRAVHDLFGHSMAGNQFGPKGETNAFLDHARMFSPLARKAMATETLGQNAWFNYGRANEGKPVTDRKFADQKAFLLDPKLYQPLVERSEHGDSDLGDAHDDYRMCPCHHQRGGPPGDHNDWDENQHPRDEHGRFGSGESEAARSKEKGGDTFDPRSGDHPAKGYAVSVFKGREQVIPGKDAITGDHIRSFVEKNRDVLDDPSTKSHVGTWYNPDDDSWYVDVSRVEPALSDAAKLGRDSHQLAIYDLKRGEAIDAKEYEEAIQGAGRFAGRTDQGAGPGAGPGVLAGNGPGRDGGRDERSPDAGPARTGAARVDEFSPEEQRDPHGEWASGGAADSPKKQGILGKIAAKFHHAAPDSPLAKPKEPEEPNLPDPPAPFPGRKYEAPVDMTAVPFGGEKAAAAEAKALTKSGGLSAGKVCAASEAPSAAELHATQEWMSEVGYDTLNRVARRGDTSVISKQLDAAIGKQTLAQDTTLYRGMRSPHGNSLEPGSVVTDRGFVSTSTKHSVADHFTAVGEITSATVFEIHAPKGAHALDLTHANRELGLSEYEVLLPRDSRFRVDSTTVTGGVTHVRATLLPGQS